MQESNEEGEDGGDSSSHFDMLEIENEEKGSKTFMRSRPFFSYVFSHGFGVILRSFDRPFDTYGVPTCIYPCLRYYRLGTIDW